MAVMWSRDHLARAIVQLGFAGWAAAVFSGGAVTGWAATWVSGRAVAVFVGACVSACAWSVKD